MVARPAGERIARVPPSCYLKEHLGRGVIAGLGQEETHHAVLVAGEERHYVAGSRGALATLRRTSSLGELAS